MDKTIFNFSLLRITASILTLFSFINAQTDELSSTESSNFPVIFLSFIIIALSVAIIILYLKYSKLKKTKRNGFSDEFDALKHSYTTLKKSLISEQEQKDLLKNQIREFQNHISQLEEINTTLLEQKIKLQSAKQNLEELQTQKDELFAIAIHDIKNPASAIKGYIELINGYDLNAQEQQEIMINLAESSNQVVRLAQEISKVMARQRPVEMMKFEKTSLKKIIDNICSVNSTYAKKKGVKLLNQSSDSLPPNKIDKEKIAEAIENLVNNAIKYAPPETIIHVRTFFNREFVTVEVSDNGVGLSEEDAKKAFSKGSILTPKPTAGEDSSGLGLWIVKRIIEEHGGQVMLKSKLGIGSTFSFQLPIIED